MQGRRQRASAMGFGGPVHSVSYAANGGLLASGGADRVVRVHDASSGAARRQLEGHTDRVLAVAASQDGVHIASGSEDGTVRVWDTRMGPALHIFSDAQSAVTSVAMSSDGQTIACGAEDGRVLLWCRGPCCSSPNASAHAHTAGCVPVPRRAPRPTTTNPPSSSSLASSTPSASSAPCPVPPRAPLVAWSAASAPPSPPGPSSAPAAPPFPPSEPAPERAAVFERALAAIAEMDRAAATAEQRAADAERRAAEAEARAARLAEGRDEEAAALRRRLEELEGQLEGAERLDGGYLKGLSEAQLDALAERLHAAIRRVEAERREAIRREAAAAAAQRTFDCCLCLERRPLGERRALHPCGHVVCGGADCGPRLIAERRPCPQCRAVLTGISPIFE
eukprot:tig00000451_g967.t1